jgi:hypothetical protein
MQLTRDFIQRAARHLLRNYPQRFNMINRQRRLAPRLRYYFRLNAHRPSPAPQDMMREYIWRRIVFVDTL